MFRTGRIRCVRGLIYSEYVFLCEYLSLGCLITKFISSFILARGCLKRGRMAAPQKIYGILNCENCPVILICTETVNSHGRAFI